MIGAVLLAALLGSGPAQAADGVLIIGTGGLAGAYDAVGGAVARIVDEGRASHGLRLAVEPTNGAEENLRRLRAGDLDLAIVPSDIAADSRQGAGLFQDEGPFPELRTLLTLYPETITVIARADSGIGSLADLAQKRVNLGPAGERTRGLAAQLLIAQGVALNTVSIGEYSAAEQVGALCRDLLDAIVIIAPHPSGTIAHALAACPTVLLPVDPAVAAALSESNPTLAPATIPGSLYGLATDDIAAVGPMVALVARADLPEETAHAIVQAVVDGADRLDPLYPVLHAVSADSLLGPTLGAPLHDGAARLLAERAGSG